MPNLTVKQQKPGKTVEEKDDEKPGGSKFESTKPSLQRLNPLIVGIGVAGTGYLVYTGIKDGIALLGAPETGGASLLLLAVP